MAFATTREFEFLRGKHILPAIINRTRGENCRRDFVLKGSDEIHIEPSWKGLVGRMNDWRCGSERMEDRESNMGRPTAKELSDGER